MRKTYVTSHTQSIARDFLQPPGCGESDLQIGIGRRRYTEFHPSRYRLGVVQRFQLAPEQVRREAERTRLFVEHGHQIVGHYVLVGF